jgi:hypothetical protein
LTIMSTDTERLTAAIGRRVRAIAARFRHSAKPKSVTRAEFMPMVRDRDRSHPELYGLLTGRVDAEGVVKERLNEPDVSTEHAKATQACLPIGPCCC